MGSVRTRVGGLAPHELAPGELILRVWPVHRGLGVLTSSRVLLLSLRRLRPFLRREVDWSMPLSEIREVTSLKLGDIWAGLYGKPVHGQLFEGVEGDYAVLVDGVAVLKGYPKQVQELMALIEEARGRCQGSDPRPSSSK
jgi:hypothetical protein